MAAPTPTLMPSARRTKRVVAKRSGAGGVLTIGRACSAVGAGCRMEGQRVVLVRDFSRGIFQLTLGRRSRSRAMNLPAKTRTAAWTFVFVGALALVGVGVYLRSRSVPQPPRAADQHAATPPPLVMDIAWDASASSFRGWLGEPLFFRCPPHGVPASVWGSGVYTDDSSICSAAIHAGRATLEGGGTFAIAILPGQSSYEPSTQNDFSTTQRGSWPGSFRFSEPSRPASSAQAGRR